MTVIAWDGRCLAADKRASGGSQHYTVTKIHRVDGCLVAFSGTADRWGYFLEWLRNGRPVGEYPANPENDSVFVLVVHPDGKVERFEDTPYPILVEDGCCAMGSGRDYARAAMHLGCDAVRAVEVASQFDGTCGNGVDVLRFVKKAKR